MTDRYTEICRSHWLKFESDDEHAERVERCTNEAFWFFEHTVYRQKAAFDQTLSDIAPYRDSPRWERMRDVAKRKYREDTAPAYELFLTAFEELLRDGEVSEATSDAWDDLAKQGQTERSAA